LCKKAESIIHVPIDARMLTKEMRIITINGIKMNW